MQKIDRLGWAVGLAVNTYGLKIGLRANNGAALESLLPTLPPHWQPAETPVVDFLYSGILGGSGSQPGVRRYHLLYAGAGRIARTMDIDEWCASLERHMQMLVAEHARRRVFVHAGVVGWKGRAIVLPGRSYYGKSTIVAELVRQGATYYSDEYAVVDQVGRIHPYARPLVLRSESGRPPTPVPVESLGGGAARKPLRTGTVVVTRYRAGVRGWRPKILSTGQGLLELLANTVPARRKPVAAMAALRNALVGAVTLKGQRGDARGVAAQILARVEGAPG
jgi:hypothetical protein